MEVARKVGILSFVIFFTLVLLFSEVSLAQDNLFTGNVKLLSDSLCTRVLIQVPERTGYVVKDSDTPPRIVLNLFPLQAKFPSREIPTFDRFIKKISILKDSRNVVKTILDLNISTYNFNVFFQKNPSFVIVEVRALGKDPVSSILGFEGVDEKKGSLALSPSPGTGGKEGGMWKVIIDPGHGGKDPGAIGPSGVKEKDITLGIAYELLSLLNQNPKFEAYLTRKDDEFVSLDKRTEIANILRGDLFISIHTNAAWDSRAMGIETFYNSHYPYGEGAEEVALRENAALASENIPSSVKNIIWDLIQNQYRKESKDFSFILQQELVKVCGGENRGVKSAPFYVLRGANMPSVLVEVGFISNPWEERKLKNRNYQKLVAMGIYRAIERYFNMFSKR